MTIFQPRHTTTKGFTLLELLVVVGLIAVVSAIGVAALNQARQRAEVAAAAQFAKSLDTRLVGDAEAAVVGMWNMEKGGGAQVADSARDNDLDFVGASAWDADDTPLELGAAVHCAVGATNCLAISGRPLANMAELSSNTKTQVTMALWVKIHDMPSPYANLIRIGGNTVSLRLHSNGSLRALFTTAGVDMYADKELQRGRWYHVAFIYDGTKAEVYINGNRVGVDTSVTPLALGHQYIYVGSGANGLDMSVWNPRIFYTSGI